MTLSAVWFLSVRPRFVLLVLALLAAPALSGCRPASSTGPNLLLGVWDADEQCEISHLNFTPETRSSTINGVTTTEDVRYDFAEKGSAFVVPRAFGHRPARYYLLDDNHIRDESRPQTVGVCKYHRSR